LNKLSLLKKYCSRLVAVERKALLTKDSYKFEIKRFLDYLDAKKIAPGNTNVSVLTEYIAMRHSENDINSRSVSKAVSALRSFYRFLMDEGLSNDNPAYLLECPKRKSTLPEVLDKDTIEDLLGNIDLQKPKGLRDRCLFELIYSAGLRVSEASGLNILDIDFESGTAKVKGKGNKERLVIFGHEASQQLKQYLSFTRPKLAGKTNKSDALFISKNGKRLSRKGIWKNYAKYACLSGISTHVHTLRHSFATSLLSGGADLRSVQELMGHADIATTQIYTHVDTAILKENHRRYLPKLNIGNTLNAQRERMA